MRNRGIACGFSDTFSKRMQLIRIASFLRICSTSVLICKCAVERIENHWYKCGTSGPNIIDPAYHWSKCSSSGTGTIVRSRRRAYSMRILGTSAFRCGHRATRTSLRSDMAANASRPAAKALVGVRTVRWRSVSPALTPLRCAWLPTPRQ